MPVKTIVSIWPLFAGLSLIGLAVGVQGSLLGVRAEIEGFDDYLIGLLMSCYFAGFLAGSLLTPKMIQRVGHIRIFAALSAVASVTILVHSIYVNPWAWALMRLLTGFAFSTIYVVSESWLNQASNNTNRGQILSIYTSILLAGICAGQFMLNVANPREFTLFILISVMVSVAAVPILLSVITTPRYRRNRAGYHAPSLVSHAHGCDRYCSLTMGIQYSVWYGRGVRHQARLYRL